MQDSTTHLDLIEGATLCLYKPLGMGSFGLVHRFRYMACRHLGIKKLKVGHAGTLDPLASGVMVICTGKHTKRIESLQQGDKEYIATLRLGQTTPTYDLESEVDAEYPTEHITRELIEETLPQFIGQIDQVPPIFSAVKVDGKRAYDLARKGKEVELKPKRVHIEEIEILGFQLPELTIRVRCGRGTYIRSLARDLALALGSGAHLTALERTQVGDAKLAQCLRLEDIPEWLERNVIPAGGSHS